MSGSKNRKKEKNKEKERKKAKKRHECLIDFTKTKRNFLKWMRKNEGERQTERAKGE